uniref:Metallo-beta-lactamase domain-containing protein 1 n=1 Tax=Caenorhabditis japonica TaxID=281687 RepID=A0A8R1DGF1_CAEJA
MIPPQPITQIITPASKRKPKPPQRPPQIKVQKLDDKPSVEDYEQLASMIQMFIDRRSHKQNGARTEKPIKTSLRPKSSEKTTKKEKEHINLTTLSTLPEQIITASKNKDSQEVIFDINTVYILFKNGSAEQTVDGQYVFIATITLVKDRDKNILVDTGLGTNINAKSELIRSLEIHGLTPSSIDIVVSTHGHPDHVGGVHEFPDALHYQGWYSHQGTKFNLTALFENDSLNLSENVMLVKCRGHTSDDIAVVVRDAKGRGDVLVSGDLFMRGEDIDHPMMWQPLSADIIAQRESRRRYGCIVDWVVPGHGGMFRVTDDVKKALKC